MTSLGCFSAVFCCTACGALRSAAGWLVLLRMHQRSHLESVLLSFAEKLEHVQKCGDKKSLEKRWRMAHSCLTRIT